MRYLSNISASGFSWQQPRTPRSSDTESQGSSRKRMELTGLVMNLTASLPAVPPLSWLCWASLSCDALGPVAILSTCSQIMFRRALDLLQELFYDTTSADTPHKKAFSSAYEEVNAKAHPLPIDVEQDQPARRAWACYIVCRHRHEGRRALSFNQGKW